MPKKFSYSVFQLDNKDNKLIDFNTDPDNLLTDTYNYNQSESDRKIKKDREILRYLIIHPLRVACSLQVSNRNDSFIQEYIISQMLLLWVRKNNDFDGIAYHSCSAVEEAHNLNEYNVVFPAKDIKNDYCKRLSGIFQISKPIKVESCHIYKEFLSSIETVSEFTNDLEFIICNNNKLYLYNEVFSLCKSFLMIFDCLLNDKYYNAEVFYQTMFTFNIMSNIINENIEFFTQKVVDKFATTYPNCEKQNIVYEFLSVVNRFRKDIQPILFELQDFISNVKKYCKPDFLTLEYVNKDQIKLEEIKIEEKSLL